MYNQFFWHHAPHVARNFYSPHSCNPYDRQLFASWLQKLPHCRVVADLDSALSVGQLFSRIIPNAYAGQVYHLLLSARETFTILINDVETVYPALVNARSQLNVPYDWRLDDIVATFSTSGSGIGYHAGHEDAFIAQDGRFPTLESLAQRSNTK